MAAGETAAAAARENDDDASRDDDDDVLVPRETPPPSLYAITKRTPTAFICEVKMKEKKALKRRSFE